MRFGMWVWLAATCMLAAVPPAEASTVDQEYIHAMYNDGEFRAVLDSLEPIMARSQKFAREDSIFIAKHLAVIYSADPSQREKGRYHMYQLLDLVPSAKLLDMYASEDINRLFDNTKEEYSARKATAPVAPPAGRQNDTSAHFIATLVPPPATVPQTQPAASAKADPATVSPRANPPANRSASTESVQHSSSKAWLWAGAGLAVVAVGGAALYVLESNSPGGAAQTLQVDARTP